MERKPFIIASLVGAVVMVLLSSIPVINLINCLLCAGLWIGGAVGVWFYRRRESEIPSVGQGTAIGALAGVIGAVLNTIVGAIFGGAMLASLVSADPSGTLEGALGGALAGGSIALIGFFFNILFYPFFGAIGGALMAAIMTPSASKTG